MMEQFTKQNLQLLRTEVTNALHEIETKHNIMFTVGSMKYQDNKVRIGLECFTKITTQSNNVNPKHIRFYNELAELEKFISLKTEDYGKIFKYGDGNTYMFVGLIPKARKNRVVAERVGGGDKLFRFDVNFVSNCFRKENN